MAASESVVSDIDSCVSSAGNFNIIKNLMEHIMALCVGRDEDLFPPLARGVENTAHVSMKWSRVYDWFLKYEYARVL